MTKPSVRLSIAGAAAIMLAAAQAGLHAHPLGPLTNQQLAEARAATVQYHDVAQVLADGYVPMGFNPEEGVFEFVNFALVDCTFDPTHPEGLSFAPSGNGLRLVGVEYSIPWACTPPGVPPQGFAGDDDVWGQEMDLPIWRLNVMIWSGSHAGPFASAGDGGPAH